MVNSSFQGFFIYKFQGEYAHLAVNHIVGFAMLGPQPVDVFRLSSMCTEDGVMFLPVRWAPSADRLLLVGAEA